MLYFYMVSYTDLKLSAPTPENSLALYPFRYPYNIIKSIDIVTDD